MLLHNDQSRWDINSETLMPAGKCNTPTSSGRNWERKVPPRRFERPTHGSGGRCSIRAELRGHTTKRLPCTILVSGRASNCFVLLPDYSLLLGTKCDTNISRRLCPWAMSTACAIVLCRMTLLPHDILAAANFQPAVESSPQSSPLVWGCHGRYYRVRLYACWSY